MLGAFLPLRPLGGLPCLCPAQLLMLFLPTDPGLPRGPWLSKQVSGVKFLPVHCVSHPHRPRLLHPD